MEPQGLHRGLEPRLAALADRIEALRRAMDRARGTEKLEAHGELEALKKRHQVLAERLRALNQEGPGLRQSLKAEWETMADDLSGIIEDFLLRLDAKYLGARPNRPERKW